MKIILFIVFYIVALVCIVFGGMAYETSKKKKSNHNSTINNQNQDENCNFYFGTKNNDNDIQINNNIHVTSNISVPRSEYEYKTIKVAGVSFKNGRRCRQTILREMKFGDGAYSKNVSIDLEPYIYEDKQAYAVIANNEQIGSIPSDMVDYIQNNYNRIVCVSDYEVYGGGKKDNGEKINYGCKITIKLRNNN